MSVTAPFTFAVLIASSANVAAQKIVFKPGDPGVQPPVLVKEIKPSYTPAAMHDQIAGTVLLEAVVDAKGRPRQIKVVKPLERGLDQMAVETLGKWRFTPATKEGKPVDYALEVPMTFDIRGGHRNPVYDCGKGDLTSPSVVKEVPPRYSSNAMRARAQGTIELEGIVEADGSVTSVRLLKPVHPELNLIAFNAFLQWRFKPGMRAGVPVACRVTVEFSMSLG